MFGRKRKKIIREQAMFLMDDWQRIVEEFETLDCGSDAGLFAEYSIAIAGTLAYYVAGLNHVDTAQEMVEILKEIFPTLKDGFNPKGINASEAGLLANDYYKKAREISDRLMAEGKNLPEITHSHAVMILESLVSEPSEADIDSLDRNLNFFYVDTYDKYYG